MDTPTRRKVHDEAEARVLLAELASSPESLSAFCGRLGIDGRSLACWQRNLTRRTRPTAGAVRLVELVASSPQRRAVYRVLVGDVAVEVEDDFVADTLVRLLDAVRAC
jgi:hypothetical protein